MKHQDPPYDPSEYPWPSKPELAAPPCSVREEDFEADPKTYLRKVKAGQQVIVTDRDGNTVMVIGDDRSETGKAIRDALDAVTPPPPEIEVTTSGSSTSFEDAVTHWLR